MPRIKKLSRLNFYDFVKRDGIQYYDYSIIPEIPVSNTDVFYTIKEGDRPDLISYKYYNTPDLWWAILQANNIRFWGDVKAGDVIRIPNYNTLVNLITKS